MAVYAITGKLGSGKGKAGVQRIRDYLKVGKRVATNCDIFLEHLMPQSSRDCILRVPDKPSVSDFYALGSGNKFIQFDVDFKVLKDGYEFTAPSPKILSGFDESHNGALVLDECGSWLNTRNYQDKSRVGLLEWAIHARKYGWDVYFICQNIKQVDSQLRESLFEYVVRLTRLDRMKIPFLSTGVKLLSFGAVDGSLPRMHIGTVRLGCSPDALVADRWMFRGDDLNDAYNTTQVFSESYPHAVHSVLSAWHLSCVVGVDPNLVSVVRPGVADHVLLRPRFSVVKKVKRHMAKFVLFALLVGSLLGFFFGKSSSHVAPVVVAHSYSSSLSATGFIQDGSVFFVFLSDGRLVRAVQFKKLDSGFESLVDGNVWVRGN